MSNNTQVTSIVLTGRRVAELCRNVLNCDSGFSMIDREQTLILLKMALDAHQYGPDKNMTIDYKTATLLYRAVDLPPRDKAENPAQTMEEIANTIGGKCYVDPPDGWRYGFPKVYDPDTDGSNVTEWLIEQGYPEKVIEKMGKTFYCRMWQA